MMRNKIRRRISGMFAAGTAALLALTACSGGNNAEGSGNTGEIVTDGSLTVGLSDEPANLVAGADTGTVGYTMNALIHRGLMAYNGDGELIEGLAESVESPDPQTYEFVLRPDLEFSDGTPITSETVAATLEYLSDPDSSAHVYAGLKDIESVDTSDPLNFVVHLSQPNNAFLQWLAVPTAAIVPEDTLGTGSDAWVGAGPFKVEERNEGTNIVLTRNDSYYDATEVDLETLDIVFYPDGAARTNALLGGDVDIIDYVPWEDFDRVSDTDGMVLDSQDGPFMYLHFNVTEGPTSDPKVRQAIAHAINHENAVVAAFSGHSAPLTGLPVSEDDPNYDPAWDDMWNYDPDLSKELLAEAGYADGLDLTLLTSAQYAFHQDTALSVQSDLEAVGINATLDNPDWPTRVDKGNDGDYDIAVSGNVGAITDISYISSFVDGPANYTRSYGYSNDELNQELLAGVQAPDSTEQKQHYDNARQIITEDVPLATISSRAQGYALNDRVGGFKNLPGFLSFYSGYSFQEMSELAQ